MSWDLLVTTYSLPTITSRPSNLTTLPGAAASLCVQYTSSKTLTLQWYHNGVAIPNATGTCLSWTKLTEADLGTYQVAFACPAWTWFVDPVEIQFNSAGITTACARNKLF